MHKLSSKHTQEGSSQKGLWLAASNDAMTYLQYVFKIEAFAFRIRHDAVDVRD